MNVIMGVEYVSTKGSVFVAKECHILICLKRSPNR